MTGAGTLWIVLIGACGRETGRVSLADQPARGVLPLRQIAQAGLNHKAVAIAIVRSAANGVCDPCPAELSAIETARHTLQPIGLRLHDYILWHKDRCVSLRLSGKL